LEKAARCSAEEAELRKFARYFRIFTVLLTWTSRTGRTMHSEGLTRDISAGGMFIVACKNVSVGSSLTYNVHIPALHRTGLGLRIAGWGQVVRVERMADFGNWSGFAVKFSDQIIRAVPSRQEPN
jgi:hypothetical protein